MIPRKLKKQLNALSGRLQWALPPAADFAARNWRGVQTLKRA